MSVVARDQVAQQLRISRIGFGQFRQVLGDENLGPGLVPGAPRQALPEIPPVRTQVGADARCAVVAAASVLAKVERDALMAGLEDPGYDWASNKGYATPAHVAGLGRLGAGDQHRRSWRLPGLESFATG